MSDNGARPTRDQALATLRDQDKFLLTTHERPDGDAVGSLAAMQHVLTALGKDSVAFLPADEFPLPYEYRFIRLEGLITEPPADMSERIMVFLDCGNIARTPAAALERSGRCILNIDHHHDNTRFGTLNHVDPHASCTAEMVWDLAKGLGVEVTQPIAEALYVGVVTDTGRFMYENTGSRAHEMAAELIHGGIDVHAIYRRLYEGIPQGKLELLARGLSNVQRSPAPTRATRRVSSTIFARSRGRLWPAWCATCWATVPRRSARSRCAPPTTASTYPRSPGRPVAEATGGRPASRPTWISRSWSSSCAARSPSSCRVADGVILVDKPAGVTSHDVVASQRRRLSSKVGHAGTLDPFATGLLLVLVGRATRAQRFLMALRKRYETVARLGYVSTTGDVEGEIAPGRMPSLEALPTGTIRQRPPAYSAVKVGGRRAYALARRGEAVELPERSVHVSRFALLWRDGERAGFEIECSSGTYVRSLIADLGDAYCL